MSEVISELRPGQKLNIVCKGVVVTPFGEQEQETVHTTTYEEILAKFQIQTRAKKPVNVNTEAREFSKQCTLLVSVLQTGKWRTGADADRCKVVEKLVTRFKTLKPESYRDLSDKSLTNIEEMLAVKSLKPERKKELKDMLDKIKAGRSTVAA